MLSHWKAKIASLLVAIAVWYLLKGHIGRHEYHRIVSDPGAPIAAAFAAGIPGGGAGRFNGAEVVLSALVAAERPQAELTRLHWVELGEFSAGVTEFPRFPCA